jgi:hypothetical protein
LQFENTNVRLRLDDVVDYVENDDHVKLLRISSEVNQLILDRCEYKLMSSNSLFTKTMHFFQRSAVFLRAFVVRQYVDIVCVSQRSRVRVELVAHFQQICVIEEIQ